MGDRSEGFHVFFWGVRGSYPTSNPNTAKFGGHTSCVEVQANGHRLIFDAGTGIIPLGKELLRNAQSSPRLFLFLSHTHHDHLAGLYFFEPLLKATTNVFIFGPDAGQKSLKQTLEIAMDGHFSPISLEELKGKKKIHSLHGRETIRFQAGSGKIKIEKRKALQEAALDEVQIDAHKSPAHPKNGVMLYRVRYRGGSVVYATDIEEKEGGYPDVIEFAKGADLLIHDAQYLKSEYFSRTDPRTGWGHSTVERAVEVARKAGVKRLLLFHHEPTHDDEALLQIEREAQSLFPASAAACEGMKVDLMSDRS